MSTSQASDSLSLLPHPRSVFPSEGTFSLPQTSLIVLDSPHPRALLFTATYLQRALKKEAGVAWEIVASPAVPREQVGAVLRLIPGSVSHPQGYELLITNEQIAVKAGTPVGIHYAVMTLTQILKQHQGDLPALQIEDWPDFPNRGVMLDISRSKVPTVETLYHLVDLLSSWKINQLQLYTEHTFAYRNHPQVWAAASPVTGAEILALDAYCQERFIELVPNQNSFGHMRRWFVHERYRPLAEDPSIFKSDWACFDQSLSLCPDDPGSLELLRSLYDELLPHFSSRQINVGCDETMDLGKGRSQQMVSQLGNGWVYLDFLLKIYQVVRSRGYTMQFWDDILISHPDIVAELPQDIIALEWGYEAGHPFDQHGAILSRSGIPFYVCPGTSSWNSLAGRTGNALENLRSAAENGLKHGAIGYLITDWGDNGHWQPLPVSYLGFAYGAAVSWGYESNRDQDIAEQISCHAFEDRAGVIGQIAYDLGNVHRLIDRPMLNITSLFHILLLKPEEIRARYEHHVEGLRRTQAAIEEIVLRLARAEMEIPDAGLVRREFTWVANMLHHACLRGIWAVEKSWMPGEMLLRARLAHDIKQLSGEYQRLWLARNRVGGLDESAAHLAQIAQDYLAAELQERVQPEVGVYSAYDQLLPFINQG
jgi:hypothetical protein